MEETVTMSQKELERIKILTQASEGVITQAIAGKRLNLSERHIRRLLYKLKAQGDRALISGKRGKPSNRSMPREIKTKTLEMIQKHYADFGPRLANEYLKKNHNINISTETLRLWMIKSNLWFLKEQRNKKLYPPRERRRCFGELIQVDGSHHDWFEGRSVPCVLMVFIDDATSAITSLHFAESETLEAYYHCLEKHIKTYGIPLTIYGDRCSVLTPRTLKAIGGGTQFQKALKELGCELILALSPQAKGRVERANRTLQDRLVKELRLRNISTIEKANEILEEYRENYNKIFSKKPSEHRDAHRPLEGTCLENILCIRETRTLNKDSIVQFRNTFYKISSQDKKVHFFKGCKVEIRQLLNGKILALFRKQSVEITPLNKAESPALDAKQIISWEPKKHYIPSSTHPFKHGYILERIKQEMLQNVV